MSAANFSHLLRRVALLLLFWAAVIHFLVVLPPFEGSDEDKHFGYVTHLRQTGQFPDPRNSLQLPARQASGQAPLYYLLVWLWSDLAPAYTWDGSLPLNPYVNPNRPVVFWPDNANVFMFGPDQIPFNPPLAEALMWQRFLSPLIGILAVALAYAAARLLLSRTWALFASLLFAFNPVLIFMFSSVTNDAAAILTSTAITFCLVLLLRRPPTPRLLFVTGLVFGLAALTKANVLVFAPIAVMAALLTGRSPWPRLRNAALVSLPILLIGAPWYIWNGIQHGDPFGIQPHLRTFWALPTPRSMADALLWTLRDNAYLIRSVWYGVASGVVMSTHSVLIAPVALLILSIVGYMRCWRELFRRYCLTLLTLGLICAAIFAAYVRWLTIVDSVTGRLLLPGYPALVLVVTLALAYGWSPGIARFVRLISGAAIVFGAVIITGNITLPWFYTMFTMPPETLAPLQGESARFGDVEFIGYRIEPERLTPDVVPRATVCWRSLREDERLPVPYAVAFHIVAQDGTVYYGRDSFPGLGLYTNWQPMRAFCDRFTMEQREDTVSGRGYRVSIGLFDPATQERIPENDGKTFVGWIAAPGPPLTEAERTRAPYHFEGVYLLDYELSEMGDSFELTASWGTGDWQARPLTAFIHVVDASGNLTTQLDTPLGGEIYPSALWGYDERTFTGSYTLSLPDSLPQGAYCVLLGLYDSQTLARLTVEDADGEAQADSVVRVGALLLTAGDRVPPSGKDQYAGCGQ